jgi:hypothetical protein
MKFSSFFNRPSSNRFSLMLVTLLVIVGLGSIYYFFYLNNRERSLDDHYYRSVRHIRENIQSNVRGSFTMARASAFAAVHKSLLELKAPDTTDQTSQSIVGALKEDRNAPWVNKRSGLEFIGFTGDRESMKDLQPGEIEADTVVELTSEGLADTVFHFEVRMKKPESLVVRFRATLTTFLLTSLDNGTFDHFVITKNDTVVYESFPSGLVVFNPDTIADGDKEDLRETPVVRLDGEEFRCYTAPFSIAHLRGWKITGLRSEEKISAIRHTVPRSLRFTVFLVLLFSILAIPFIKSFIMSRTERLQTIDIVFSLLSFAATVSLAAILLFDGYLHYDADRGNADTRLRSLSENIQRNLKNELSDINKELSIFAVSMKSGLVPVHKYYPGGKHYFIVDSTGKTNDPDDKDYPLDVRDREYYRRVTSGRFDYPLGPDYPMVLEPIISWREGVLRAAVAIPCGKDSAAVVSTALQSFSSPVIPKDFGFCLVTREGKVLFHSNPAKSINENFLQECENESDLVAAINARQARTLSTVYSANPALVHIRPVEHTSLFLVTFTSQAPIDAVHGWVFGISMVLQSGILLVYLLIAVTIFFSGYKKSRLAVPHFSFAFFLPRRHNSARYTRTAFYNLLQCILLLGITYFQESYLGILFVFFISPVYVSLFNFYLLADRPVFRRVTESTLKRALGIASMVVLVAFFSAGQFLETVDFALYFMYQLLSFGLYFAARKASGLRLFRKLAYYKDSYRMMIYTTIMLMCIVPVVRFTVLTYNGEKTLALKTIQLDLADAGAQRLKNGFDSIGSVKFMRGDYSSSFDGTVIAKSPYVAALRRTQTYDAFFKTLRTSVQDAGVRSSLLASGASDGSWTWVQDGDTLRLQVASPRLFAGGNITLSSASPAFSLPAVHYDFWNAARTWLLFFMLLVALYSLLHFFTRRLFSLEKLTGKRFMDLDKRLFAETSPEYRIFVTGLPCSGKSDYFKKLYSGTPHFFILDLIGCRDKEKWAAEVAAALAQEDGVLLIDHFEYDCLSVTTNRLKLQLLESLVRYPKKRVVIVSAINPEAFLELYSTPGATEASLGENIHRTGDRWNKALACFYELWFPIRGFGYQNEKLSRLTRTIPAALGEAIRHECDNGYFLRKIGEELCKEVIEECSNNDLGKTFLPGSKELLRKEEDIVLKVQKLAHVYYLSTWALLTKEEQYVLFDLAQDGLVNSKNLDVIERLSSKGLVIFRDSLQPMNRSFQNFILTVVEPGDLMKIEQSVREAGAWDKFKKPLFVIVAALIVFIFRTDQNQMLTYLTTFAAGIPLVIGLVGMFGKNARKKE